MCLALWIEKMENLFAEAYEMVAGPPLTASWEAWCDKLLLLSAKVDGIEEPEAKLTDNGTVIKGKVHRRTGVVNKVLAASVNPRSARTRKARAPPSFKKKIPNKVSKQE
jgi:hypothetical protein